MGRIGAEAIAPNRAIVAASAKATCSPSVRLKDFIREMPSMRLGTCAASSTLAATTLSGEKPMCGIEMRLKVASLTTIPLQQTNRNIAA
jgi:hypothetical protein